MIRTRLFRERCYQAANQSPTRGQWDSEARAAPDGGATVKFTATPEQRQLVEHMVAAGVTQETIARRLGCSVDTLQRHFPDALEHGREDVNAEIGRSIVQQALEGDKTMLVFMAKVRLGWSERTNVGYLGADGRPVDPPQGYVLNIIGVD